MIMWILDFEFWILNSKKLMLKSPLKGILK